MNNRRKVFSWFNYYCTSCLFTLSSFHVILKKNPSLFFQFYITLWFNDLSILLYRWIYCDKMIDRIRSILAIFLCCHKSTTTNLDVTMGQDCSHREIWNAYAWRMKRESKVEAISLQDDPTGRRAPGNRAPHVVLLHAENPHWRIDESAPACL